MQLVVNGVAKELDVEAEMPLLWALRDELDLTGTKYGCGVAYCGACTVLLDGQPVRSCSLPVARGRRARRSPRSRGSSRGDTLHRVQTGVDRAPGAAVRLLPVGPDHGGGRRCSSEAASDRRRDRRGHDQRVSLRNLHADSRGDPRRGEEREEARRWRPNLASCASSSVARWPAADSCSASRCAPFSNLPARAQRSSRATARSLLTDLGEDRARQHGDRDRAALRDGAGRAHVAADDAGRRARRRLEPGAHGAGARRSGVRERRPRARVPARRHVDPGGCSPARATSRRARSRSS